MPALSVNEVKDIPWNDPGHQAFFKYQAYLAKFVKDKGAPAVVFSHETEDTWKRLSKEERVKRVAEGEAYLKGLLEDFLGGKTFINQAQAELLQSVLDPEVMKGLAAVMTARSFNNPAQIKAAQDALARLKGRFGGIDVDLDGAFDGSKQKGGVFVDQYAKLGKVDYLKPDPQSPFLDSLSSPEIAAVVNDRQKFQEFLDDKKVSPQAVPGLMAMYDTITNAPPEVKAELAHILPTVVRFIKDGNTIFIMKEEGALGMAVPGKYDLPQAAGLNAVLVSDNPDDPAFKGKAHVAGKTLAHEFQHIYDMYTGRYYTLDSELRGFKTAMLYFEALKKGESAMYDTLLNNDDDEVRGIVRDFEDYAKAYKEGPKAFAQTVSQGHGYARWYEGVFQGRAPLRHVLDPEKGAPAELDAWKALRERAKGDVAALERELSELGARRDKTPSRQSDKEYEKTATDLKYARFKLAQYEGKAAELEMRIRRMRSELDWLNKKSRAKGEKEPPQFDMNLAVDKDYVTP
ncbi:MAG: hypothetical protein HY748_09620 [Elusimicrobia bacterium]|nr:hypothetical protein [Elusimicrobiota bacterium]